jgi:hypothetical protein
MLARRGFRPSPASLDLPFPPDVADKVVPLLREELARRHGHTLLEARRVERELWALTPHLFAVNAKPDLVANIGRALAEGLLALAP